MSEQRRPFFSIANTNESNDQPTGSAFSGEDPQNMGPASQRLMNMLHELNDRLRKEEGDREKLWEEIDSVRDVLSSLEGRSDQAERVFLNLENKLNRQDNSGLKNLQKWRALIEDNQRALYAQIKKVRAENEALEEGQKNIKRVSAKLQERVQATETSIGSAFVKIGESEVEQKKLAEKIELARENRLKLLKKMEGLEETLLQTQDTLRAKALVMLTDQSVAKHASATVPLDSLNRQETYEEEAPVAPWRTTRDVPQKKTAKTKDSASFFDDRHPFKIEKSKKRSDFIKYSLASAAVITILVAAGVWISENKSNLSLNLPNIDTSDFFGPSATETATTTTEQVTSTTQTVTETEQAAPVTITETVAPQNKDYAATEQEAVARFMERAPQTGVTSRIDPDGTLPPLVKEIEKKAFSGSGPAQHDLATIYTAGHAGVKANFEKAAVWFNEAAYNDVANARYNLGVLTQQGLGVTADQERAIELYMAASALGHPEAQYNLGIAYIEGVGVPRDINHAVYYFERAAEKGVTEAAYNLGMLNQRGVNGEAQPDEALFWYKVAADRGNPEAITALNELAAEMGLSMGDVNALYQRLAVLRPGFVEAMSKVDETRKMQELEPKAGGASDTPVSETTQNDQASVTAPAPAPQASVVTTPATPPSFAPGSQAVIVAQIQTQLMEAGLYPGPADGLTGPLTEDAVAAYQRENGLEVTGRPTEDLLAYMLKQELTLKD